MPIASVNPATGETVRTFDELSTAEIDQRLARAYEARRTWSDTPLQERTQCLVAAAGILESEAPRFGATMTLEMGKPIAAARDEARKCAAALRYYASHAQEFLSPRKVPFEAGEQAAIHYHPLGVVLAVMPWNFPFWQVVRFAAPALAAGNVALLKHASNVPQCALAIEDVFRRAGCPPGVFQTLLTGASRVAGIIADERVAAVTLTGSEAAGSSVAATAAQHLKKSVLELGGSDPFIVLPSADPRLAAQQAMKARTINNGQSCIAAKRFIVHEAIADDFERFFTEEMSALRVGDPMDEATQIGPLASEQVLSDVDRQVRNALSEGAVIRTGGKRPDRAGFFYPPTVVTNVQRNSVLCGEEVFGPVAPVLRVADADTALAMANDTPFGLGASVWTRDAAEAERFTREVQAGLVFVNSIVQSDARLPFGGVKRSGYGRELSDIGMYEFVNIKTVRAREVQAGKS